MGILLANLPVTEPEIKFLLEFLDAFRTVPEAVELFRKAALLQQKNFSAGHTPETLLIKICRITKITPEEIQGKSKKQEVADTRACISQIARELFSELSLNELCEFTNKDHSTVLTHFKRVENVKEVRELYFEIKCKLGL